MTAEQFITEEQARGVGRAAMERINRPGPDPRALLDALDEAHAKATPGPWTAATAPAEGSGETHAEYLTGALRPDEGRPLWVAWAPIVDGLHDTDYVVPIVTGDGPTSEANARFASLAHDALPGLTAAVRAALALADELDVPAGTPSPLAGLSGRIRATVTAALTGGQQT